MRGLLLVFTMHGLPTPAADGWVTRDKAQHFFMSAFVQSAAYGSLRGSGVAHGSALVAATAVTATVGIGKELRDRRVKGEFSVRDLAWDAAGTASMTLLLAHTSR